MAAALCGAGADTADLIAMYLQTALQSNGAGSWAMEFRSRKVLWSPNARALERRFCCREEAVEAALTHVHPDGRERLRRPGRWR